MMRSDQVSGYIPLSESTFFILLSLAGGAKHGYAILKEVDSLSEGRLRLSTGTLYGAIKRLLEDGWIRQVEENLSNTNGRERKAYELTDKGRKILNAEHARLRSVLAVSALQLEDQFHES